MNVGHRKGICAFALVILLSVPTQGNPPSAVASLAVMSCLRALPSQPEGSPDVQAHLQTEVTLTPLSVTSYGWVAGQLMDPVVATCLAPDSRLRSGVGFQACEGADRMQMWQWKTTGTALAAGDAMSVLQHQLTGLVLERVNGAERSDSFRLTFYRVGADTQLFSLRNCQHSDGLSRTSVATAP